MGKYVEGDWVWAGKNTKIDNPYIGRIEEVVSDHGFILYKVRFHNTYWRTDAVLPSEVICKGIDPNRLRRLINWIKRIFKG